ncbi:MAG: hypothetical protein HZB61_12960 [Nitrospirae bacterium]|nr:hypothetical protein [Nitrospirota bacterium]
MARIKIKDLPKNQKVSKEELKKIFGGLTLSYSTQSSTLSPLNPVAFNTLAVPPSWKIY